MKNYRTANGISQQPVKSLTISELISQAETIFVTMIDAAKRIIARIKGRPSCLAPMKCNPAIFPLSYDKNAAYGQKGSPVFNGHHMNWRLQNRVELYFTQTLNFIDNEIEREEIRAKMLELKQS